MQYSYPFTSCSITRRPRREVDRPYYSERPKRLPMCTSLFTADRFRSNYYVENWKRRFVSITVRWDFLCVKTDFAVHCTKRDQIGNSVNPMGIPQKYITLSMYGSSSSTNTINWGGTCRLLPFIDWTFSANLLRVENDFDNPPRP